MSHSQTLVLDLDVLLKYWLFLDALLGDCTEQNVASISQ